MTSPLYPAFQKRIADATEKILNEQVTPWAFLSSGKPMNVRRFDGRGINYEGIGFEGSPRNVFWGRYIEPFLEDMVVRELAAGIKACEERRVDAQEFLPELRGLLLAAFAQVFARMAQIDQRLLGRGSPQTVVLRPVERELSAMREFTEAHFAAELQMWKPRRWHEKLSDHKGALGLLGLIGTALTALAKCASG